MQPPNHWDIDRGLATMDLTKFVTSHSRQESQFSESLIDIFLIQYELSKYLFADKRKELQLEKKISQQLHQSHYEKLTKNEHKKTIQLKNTMAGMT